MRNDHCSSCGTKFTNLDWPRVCPGCSAWTHNHPRPVVISLVPLQDGRLITVRRAFEPQKGQLSLPGGYLEVGESWQEAAAREIREETSLEIRPSDIVLFDAVNTASGSLMLICRAPHRPLGFDITTLTHDVEVTEIVPIGSDFTELAFPTHTEAARDHFRGVYSRVAYIRLAAPGKIQ